MKSIKRTWNKKRESIYNLKDKIDSLKRKVRSDLVSDNEKDQLTALIIRIMMYTSERVGNDESAINGHFGVTQFKSKHISVKGNYVHLDYVGKSGVEHEKSFCDETCSLLISKLKKRNKDYIFVTESGFRIKPTRVNRYLKRFGAKSKDIRGFNANRMMLMELNRIGVVKEEKDRKKQFNAALKKIAAKIGHGATTLRTHYLLPEIEESFYAKGSVKSIKID